MRVLIVGGGGREHALAWKCAQSEHVTEVFVAPGNAGSGAEAGVRNVPIAADDLQGLQRFASENAIGLTIVGPEVPLVAGIADRFTAAGLPVFGPTQGAAQLEGSKSFTKDFLARHAIPTAAYETFDNSRSAIAYIERQGAPIVIKADGLAAGKGVVLAASLQEAEDTVHQILDRQRFGTAGQRVVVEEFLSGEEASFICLVDGEDVLALASSQDHKARDDGDRGPNTGGMGAYSPAPVISPSLHRRIMTEVIEPTVRGLAKEGNYFRGFLYAGLMIDADGAARVLEFNVRLGDPEAQPILLRLRSDLIELCLAALDGSLGDLQAEWDPRAALGVVMAAGGYPDDYEKGALIAGLGDDAEDLKVFHAGTAANNRGVVTAGGRVLCVTALGDDVAAARERAYGAVANIHWDNCYYRRDIGYRALDSQ
ncbi:MAG: phosphoribosylamine--glycine ligase [Gammaproteobacteria bacterium]|nr:phosphoribosylamine--glycine ligase [Gammaproteobacteria bacterium]